MAEILRDFFYQDLGEAELDKIEAMLAGDESNAERFAQCAEEFYAKLGLPEPGKPKAGWWRISLLGLLVTAALAWRALSALHSVPPTPVTPSPPAAASPAQSPVPSAAAPSPAAPALRAKAAPARPPSVLPAKVPSDAPAPTPAKLQMLLSAPSQGIALLQVTLHLPVPQSLRLRVMDSTGAEVKTLFEGPLPAGERKFFWDGTTATGPSPAGIYAVEASGEGVDLVRRIRLQVR